MSKSKYRKTIITVIMILEIFFIHNICYGAGAFDSAPQGYEGPGKPAGGSAAYDPSSNSSAAAGQNPNINQRPDALKPNGYTPIPTTKPKKSTTIEIDNKGKNPLENPDFFDPKENSDDTTRDDTTRDDTKFIGKANIIIGAIQTIGIVISVITITILGIKYMVGSIEQKAEYKKTMIPYIIGVFFLVGTITVLEIISKLKIF